MIDNCTSKRGALKLYGYLEPLGAISFAYALRLVMWWGASEKIPFKIFVKMLTHMHKVVKHLVELTHLKIWREGLVGLFVSCPCLGDGTARRTGHVLYVAASAGGHGPWVGGYRQGPAGSPMGSEHGSRHVRVRCAPNLGPPNKDSKEHVFGLVLAKYHWTCSVVHQTSHQIQKVVGLVFAKLSM